MSVPVNPVVSAARVVAVVAIVLVGGCARQAPPAPSTDVTFSPQSFERVSADCDSGGNCARIRIGYPEITGAPTPAARESLQAFILDFVLRRTDDTLRAPSVEAVIQDFLDSYEGFRRDYPDAGQGWEVDRQVAILPSPVGICSIEAREFQYTGGAHPNTSIRLASFDVRSGRRLTLSDLLHPGFGARLDSLGEQAFRAARELPADSSIADSGFWFEGGRFRLPPGFAVTSDGLRFYFNAYEVAPYALGPTDFLIPFGQFEYLIRPDGPLAERAPKRAS
jgi:hypothetical protein